MVQCFPSCKDSSFSGVLRCHIPNKQWKNLPTVGVLAILPHLAVGGALPRPAALLLNLLVQNC